MHGWKMVAARRAAARIVDTLTDADRFAVLCFDDSVERVPDASAGAGLRRPTATGSAPSSTWPGRTPGAAPRCSSRSLDARRLLTDAAAPGITGGQLTAARDRVLVLVTDGQVGNEDQILDTVGRSLAGVRVHVVGIDQAVNAGFLGRLAARRARSLRAGGIEDRLDRPPPASTAGSAPRW